MKRQIRKHTFETNSSTQHTLTICEQGTNYSDYVGTTIVLGKNVPNDLLYNENKKKNPINKLHMLWISLIGYDSNISNFIHYLDFIKKTLAKININIDVTIDESDYKEWEYYGEDLSCVMYYAFDSEENLINFLFNRDSWYDSYEDNWGECPYEKDIKPGNKTYTYR